MSKTQEDLKIMCQKILLDKKFLNEVNVKYLAKAYIELLEQKKTLETELWIAKKDRYE